MLLITLVLGVALGVGVSRSWDETRFDIEKAKFHQLFKEKDAEIKRLMAQVALHIGKEK